MTARSAILVQCANGTLKLHTAELGFFPLQSRAHRLHEVIGTQHKARFILLTPSVSDKYCRRRQFRRPPSLSRADQTKKYERSSVVADICQPGFIQNTTKQYSPVRTSDADEPPPVGGTHFDAYEYLTGSYSGV